jgi:hypothetical protein
MEKLDEQEFLARRARASNKLRGMLQITPQPSPYNHQLGGADYQAAIERTRLQNGQKGSDDENKNRHILYMIDGLGKCEGSDQVWKWIQAYFKSNYITLTPECCRIEEAGGGYDWKVIYEIAKASPFEHSYRIAKGLHAVYSEFWK